MLWRYVLAALQMTPLVVVAWIIGRIFRDRIGGTIPLSFYLLPAPLVAVCATAWLWRPRNRGPSRLRTFMRMGLILSLAQWLVIDHAWNRPRSEETDLHIVVWNMGRVRHGGARLWSAIRAEQPDICLITERPRTAYPFDPNLMGLRNGHVRVLAELVLVSKYAVLESKVIDLDRGVGVAFALLLDTPQTPLRFVAVDLHSHPELDIRNSLHRLIDELQPDLQAGLPVLLVGDFNKPHDSSQFRAFRREFARAYDLGGRGSPYTWPVPLPLWSIDHVWCTSAVDVRAYRQRSVLPSDHRMQSVRIRL